MSSGSYRSLNTKPLRVTMEAKNPFFTSHSSSNTPRTPRDSGNTPAPTLVKTKITNSQKSLLSLTSGGFLNRLEENRPHLIAFSGATTVQSARQGLPSGLVPFGLTKKDILPEPHFARSNTSSLNSLNLFPTPPVKDTPIRKDFLNKQPQPPASTQDLQEKKFQKTLSGFTKDNSQIKYDPYKLNSLVKPPAPPTSQKTNTMSPSWHAKNNKKARKVHKVSMLDQLQCNIAGSLNDIEPTIFNTPSTGDMPRDYLGENPIESLILDSQRPQNIEKQEMTSLAYVSCTDLNNVKVAATLPTINETNSASRLARSSEEIFMPSEFLKKRNERLVNKKGNSVPHKKNVVKFALESNRLFSPLPMVRSPSSLKSSNTEKLVKLHEEEGLSERGSTDTSEPQLTAVQLGGEFRAPHPLFDKNFEKKLALKRLNMAESKENIALKRTESGIGIFYFKKVKAHLNRLRQLKLSLEEVVTKTVFSKVPYQKKGSKQLIEASKIGNLANVEKILETYSKYLVYDFDHIYQTALHFAAKRGFVEIAQVLIKNGADVDAKDMTGRTPLFFAIKHNQLEIVKLLLGNCADPWATEEYNYKTLSQGSPLIHRNITEAQMMHALIRMTPMGTRTSLWQRDSVSAILGYHFLVSEIDL